MGSVVTKEAPPPCFACCPAELVVVRCGIGATLPQYGDQSLGITGQRLRGVTSRVIASRKIKRGDECRGKIRDRAVDG
jgi:hypothetical protein